MVIVAVVLTIFTTGVIVTVTVGVKRLKNVSALSNAVNKKRSRRKYRNIGGSRRVLGRVSVSGVVLLTVGVLVLVLPPVLLSLSEIITFPLHWCGRHRQPVLVLSLCPGRAVAAGCRLPAAHVPSRQEWMVLSLRMGCSASALFLSRMGGSLPLTAVAGQTSFRCW